MKSYAYEILEIWKEIEDQSIVTFKDVEKIKDELGSIAMRVDAQRKELEKSRDMWKKLYMELKK